jgi:surface antigen
MRNKLLVIFGGVFLFATTIMPIDDAFAASAQKEIFSSVGKRYYSVSNKCSSSGVGTSPGGCAALATARRALADTMSEDDKTNLYKRASVENSSSDSHKKAMMETIFNRTISWKMGSIQCTIAANDSNADCSGKNGAGYWGSKWPSKLSGDRETWDKLFDEVVGGSNFNNFADGNASMAGEDWNRRFVNAVGCALPTGEDECQPMPTSIDEVKANVEYYMRHSGQSDIWLTIVEDCGNGTDSSSLPTISGSSSIFSSASSTSTDGWLSGIAGLSKKDFTSSGTNTWSREPSIIVLHNTEGTDVDWPYGGGGSAPHFTIDLVKKQGYQHYSLDVPSKALVNSGGGVETNSAGAVQIEIVGFSRTTSDSRDLADRNPTYDLTKYTDEQWDYLATLLVGISKATNIPLQTSVTWSGDGTDVRLSGSEWSAYKGILGHQHVPENDHVDPGDIGAVVMAAIARNNGTGGNDDCEQGNSTLNEGGLTLDQAKKFVMRYGENRNNDTIAAVAEAKARGGGSPGTGCSGSGSSAKCFTDSCQPKPNNDGTSNCTFLSAFFLAKFTDDVYRGGDGSQVVNKLREAGVPTGSEPKPFAIFSWKNDGYGHTGVVLGIHGDDIIVGHASCSNPGLGKGDGTREGGGSGFIETGKLSDNVAFWGGTPTGFAYPNNIDIKAIEDYINDK